MRKNRYTLFQEAHGEPGIAFPALSRALSEAGGYQPTQRLQKYAEEKGLAIDLGEHKSYGPRYLIKLSDVQTLINGLRIPISPSDLERILEAQRNEWQAQRLKEIKRRQKAIQ